MKLYHFTTLSKFKNIVKEGFLRPTCKLEVTEKQYKRDPNASKRKMDTTSISLTMRDDLMMTDGFSHVEVRIEYDYDFIRRIGNSDGRVLYHGAINYATNNRLESELNRILVTRFEADERGSSKVFDYREEMEYILLCKYMKRNGFRLPVKNVTLLTNNVDGDLIARMKDNGIVYKYMKENIYA